MMHRKTLNQRLLQIFVKSPHHPGALTLTLTLDPSRPLTLHHLKSLIFSSSSSLNPSWLSNYYVTFNGKPLSVSDHVPISQIPPLSTLTMHPRLPGGGGDGGATGAESRDCYLNMYAEKKPDKVDPHEQRLSKWLNCALTSEPLREPCVIDLLGNFFNKEALVEALLSKRLPKEFGYIKGLKDMVNIQLTAIPGSDKLGSGAAGDHARFQCPISGLEFNGKYKFFALRGCGHVLSVKALKEVKSSSCLVCHREYAESDKIAINGSEEEVAVLRERMEEEKAKLKEKKMGAKKTKNVEVGVMTGAQVGAPELSAVRGVKRGADLNGSLGKASVKVEGHAKVENNAKGGVAVKKFKAADRAPAHANKEVYASIFTSSKKSNFKETYSCRSLPLGRN